MKRTLLGTMVVGSVVFMLAGCETLLQQERRTQAAREAAEVENLRREVSQLKNSVRDLAESRQRLYDTVDQTRVNSEAGTRELRDRMAALEASIKALEGQQEVQRREIVDTVSRKVGEIVSHQAASRPSPAVVRGREHRVEQGQTLSDIAVAYKVSVEAIVKANNLKDANTIRVGQVLFIPE